MSNKLLRFLRSLNHLPLPIQLVFRWLRNPRSPLFKLYLYCGGSRPEPFPEPTELPLRSRRVYIAPVNAADQATLWAAALEEHLPDLGSRNMMAPVIGSFPFETMEPVPLGAFHLSREWQRAEFERAAQFTNVLVESQESMFGGLFGYNPKREIEALRLRGVSVAALCHGSDVRDPLAHASRTPWSPFTTPHPETKLLQHLAAHRRRQLEELQLPIFVSTPDLLDDLPHAHWCPLITAPEFRSLTAEPLLSGERPVVTHIPSRGWLKGSELIEPRVRALEARGLITYQELRKVPKSSMPNAILSADILLEQFRLGSYGATAIEAMSLGRVVVGHVLPSVRERVAEATGTQLPIVEATPDSLESVISELVADHDQMWEIGERSREFVETVHSGRMSAKVLAEHWIETKGE